MANTSGDSLISGGSSGSSGFQGTSVVTYTGSDVTGLVNPKSLWTPEATTAFTVKFDTATQTGVPYAGIVGGYWQFPVTGVTKVYSAANGSTGLPSGAQIAE